jgi:hypothetical protein
MLKLIKIIDRVIPLWELIVVVLAIAAITLVVVLWWAFGYNLVVAPDTAAAAVKPAALGLSLL